MPLVSSRPVIHTIGGIVSSITDNQRGRTLAFVTKVMLFLYLPPRDAAFLSNRLEFTNDVKIKVAIGAFISLSC